MDQFKGGASPDLIGVLGSELNNGAVLVVQSLSQEPSFPTTWTSPFGPTSHAGCDTSCHYHSLSNMLMQHRAPTQGSIQSYAKEAERPPPNNASSPQLGTSKLDYRGLDLSGRNNLSPNEILAHGRGL